MKNTEVTGKSVSKIAGKVFAKLADFKAKESVACFNGSFWVGICTASELKSLAASALTQTQNKPKPAKAKKK